MKKTIDATRTLVLGAALLLVASLAGGCAEIDDGDGFPSSRIEQAFEGYQGDFAATNVTGAVPVLKAVMSGNMADVNGIHHVASTVDSYGTEQSVSLYVTVDTPGGAAMIILSVNNGIETGLDDGDAVPGVTAVDRTGDTYIIGCAGPEPGYWDYDNSADEHDVVIERHPDDPHLVAIHFDATLFEYSYSYDYYGEYESGSSADADEPYRVNGSILIDVSQLNLPEGYDYGYEDWNEGSMPAMPATAG